MKTLRNGLFPIFLALAAASPSVFPTEAHSEEWTFEYKRIIPKPGTMIREAYKTPAGILLFFKTDLSDRVTKNNAYYCPGTDVYQANRCFELKARGGIGSISTATSETLTRLNMGIEDGSPDYRNNPRLKGDLRNKEIDLTCTFHEAPQRLPNGQPGSSLTTIKANKVTPQELLILNERLKSGDLQLMQLPDFPDRHSLYLLPDGRYLTVFQSMTNWGDWSDPDYKRPYVFGYLGHPDNMQEVDVVYGDGRSAPLGYTIYSHGHRGDTHNFMGVLVPTYRGRGPSTWNGQPVQEIIEPQIYESLKGMGLGKILQKPELVTPCPNLKTVF